MNLRNNRYIVTAGEYSANTDGESNIENGLMIIGALQQGHIPLMLKFLGRYPILFAFLLFCFMFSSYVHFRWL